MLVITNGRIHTGTGRVFERGFVLVENGRIRDVGQQEEMDATAEVIDVGGRPVTPGLVEAHGHVGLSDEGIGWEGDDVNERTDPVTSHVSALDGINPRDKGFRDFLRGGITSVQINPGSANIIGGFTVAVKAAPADSVDEMVIRDRAGMKAALGENPKRAHGLDKERAPYTRMGSAAIMREWLFRAREYDRKRAEAGTDFDARLEALVPVVRGEIPMRIHCHRADDMLTAIRIAEEFDLLYSLEHATQGYKLPEYLAERKVLCAVGPAMSQESKVELEGVGFDTAVAFERAGVPYCLITDHPVVRARYLHLIAGVA
ncbi:MAG: amidohydrolase, partial [Clostridia bacterium]